MMTEKRTTTMVTGMSRGQVTLQKRCQALAPSMAAASSTSGFTVCSPASSVMAKKGIPRHTLTRMTETMAVIGPPSQSTRNRIRPRWNMIQFRMLKVGSNIHFQASVERTVGTIHGSSMEARISRLNPRRLFSIRATAIPRANFRKVATAV
jgi:hypothetical protein